MAADEFFKGCGPQHKADFMGSVVQSGPQFSGQTFIA